MRLTYGDACNGTHSPSARITIADDPISRKVALTRLESAVSAWSDDYGDSFPGLRDLLVEHILTEIDLEKENL